VRGHRALALTLGPIQRTGDLRNGATSPLAWPGYTVLRTAQFLARGRLPASALYRQRAYPEVASRAARAMPAPPVAMRSASYAAVASASPAERLTARISVFLRVCSAGTNSIAFTS
jgi:hypothetical protein